MEQEEQKNQLKINNKDTLKDKDALTEDNNNNNNNNINIIENIDLNKELHLKKQEDFNLCIEELFTNKKEEVIFKKLKSYHTEDFNILINLTNKSILKNKDHLEELIDYNQNGTFVGKPDFDKEIGKINDMDKPDNLNQSIKNLNKPIEKKVDKNYMNNLD